MVTTTRQVFINIFQTECFSTVKFAMGYGRNMSFFVIPKSPKVGEKSFKNRARLLKNIISSVHGVKKNGEFEELLPGKCWCLEFWNLKGDFVFLYIKTHIKLWENWLASQKYTFFSSRGSMLSPSWPNMSKSGWCCALTKLKRLFVTRYNKRYLTTLATSYWFGTNTFQP